MELIAVTAGIAALIFLIRSIRAHGKIAVLALELNSRKHDLAEVEGEIVRLKKELDRFKGIMDAEAEAVRVSGLTNAERDRILQQAQRRFDLAETRLAQAIADSDRIVAIANERAQEIAGDALEAKGKAKQYSDAVRALKNIIEGYGNEYIVPTYHLLDDLADEFGFTEAGQKLKEARDHTKFLVKAGRAASCEYAEPYRRETAVRFVTDAFNGKVDSILSRSKSDNHGKLEQEILDAAAVVTQLGTAFRNARVTDEYLKSRLEELRWAVTAKLLKDQDREQQRLLREQIREEEKARREYERAIKDAAKEEATLRKALERAREQVAEASAAEREAFEARLAHLQEQLTAAEDKNKRALSMAQQTRAGHVYVISNVGSFGEEVFKIGMTRRLEPLDRVRELGDASVPFEFDVHAMIFSDDAPGLEKKLHRHFLHKQVNKVNPRKEFFRIELPAIRHELETLGVETQWTMAAQALEYRETQRIEQQIQESPLVAAEWTRHQLEVEEEIAHEEAEMA